MLPTRPEQVCNESRCHAKEFEKLAPGSRQGNERWETRRRCGSRVKQRRGFVQSFCWAKLFAILSISFLLTELIRHAGQGNERRESRRRRGGRGKRNHEDSSESPIQGSHRTPASPKLADIIMPALKAKAAAQSQSQALVVQVEGAGTQEGKPAAARGAGDAEGKDTAGGEDATADARR